MRRIFKHNIAAVFIAGMVALSFIGMFIYGQRTHKNSKYAQIFLRKAKQCQDKCSLQERISFLKKSVYYDPSQADAYYQLGEAYEQQHEKSLALISFEQAARLSAELSSAYLKIGIHYSQQKDFPAALRYLQHAFEMRNRKTSLDSYFYLGLLYAYMGKHDLALSYLENSARVKKEPEGLLRLGMAQAKSGFIKEARLQADYLLALGFSAEAAQLREFIDKGKRKY